MKFLCLLLQGVFLVLTTNADAKPAREAAAGRSHASVISNDQRNGVTARYVNQVNQTILPTLVRGPQLTRLKDIFVEGATIKRAFMSVTTDEDVDRVCEQSDSWINRTYLWLSSHVSRYAAERFAFRPMGVGMSYSLPGDHKAGYADKWGNTHRALTDFLTNLDQLMRDPSIYPEPQ